MPCSIIIPTKDRPESLPEAVRSAAASLPESGEILVIDDLSNPTAADILADFNLPSLRILVNPGPHGPSGARNYGASQARFDLIFFLDDDDQLLPHYCRKVLKTRESLPLNCAYGHCAPLHKSGSGRPTYHGQKMVSGVYGDDTPLERRLAGLGMGFWITREAFLAVNGIDENLRVNEDTDFSIRLAKAHYSCFYDAEAGVLLTLDPERGGVDQKSITKSAKAIERARGFEHILREHSDFLLKHGAFRRKFLSRVIKYRSRARNLSGWLPFCLSHRPRWEAAMFCLVGTPWLLLSVILRKVRDLTSRFSIHRDTA